jgi:hypothetical protein
MYFSMNDRDKPPLEKDSRGVQGNMEKKAKSA